MISYDFYLNNTSEEIVLKIMTNIENSKAARVERLSPKFLKDDVNILAKAISALCNLSISKRVFPNACKVAKLNPILKRGGKLILPTAGQSHCFYQFRRSLKG